MFFEQHSRTYVSLPSRLVVIYVLKQPYWISIITISFDIQGLNEGLLKALVRLCSNWPEDCEEEHKVAAVVLSLTGWLFMYVLKYAHWVHHNNVIEQSFFLKRLQCHNVCQCQKTNEVVLHENCGFFFRGKTSTLLVRCLHCNREVGLWNFQCFCHPPQTPDPEDMV